MKQMIPVNDYVDAQETAIESRLEEKLSSFATKGAFHGATAIIIGVTLAVLAFGGDYYDAWLSSLQVVAGLRAEQARTDGLQSTKLTAIDEKLDRIIAQTARTEPR
jgi:hypothetical protein